MNLGISHPIIRTTMIVIVVAAGFIILLLVLVDSSMRNRIEGTNDIASNDTPSSATRTYFAGNDSILNAFNHTNSHEYELDLLKVCPDPQGDLSGECLQALDRIFQDRELGIFSDLIAFPNPLTYRKIFADPLEDRILVFESLERRECRLEDAGFRPDLKDSCHAEAFTSFGTFLKSCDFKYSKNYSDEWFEPSMTYDGTSRFKLEMDHIEQYRETHPKGFGRLKNEIWSEVLMARWTEKYCSQYDMSTLRIHPGTREFLLLEVISTVLTRVSSLEPSTTLTWIGARLGGGWSFDVHVFSGHMLGQSIDSFDEYLEDQHPWIRSLVHAKSPVDSRVDKVRAAIATIVSVQENGWDIDLAKLVKEVCEGTSIGRYYDQDHPKLPESGSCASAIRELNESLPTTNFQELKLLDEFERISLELGVYETAEHPL